MRLKKTRIMVFGTFDVLHRGHLNFFRQARKLSTHPFLIVSIARDVNVKKIKGKKPMLSENQRIKLVRVTKLADKVVLGGLKSYLPHILKERPDIIALGYDQDAYTHELKPVLEKRGLQVKIVRLKPHKPHVYKSSLVKAKLKRRDIIYI